MSLNFDEFQGVNEQRDRECANCLSNWTNDQWLTALTGEVGEVATELKKQSRLDSGHPGGAPLNVRHLANELADVVSYAFLLASANNINLGDAVVNKFNAVSDRINSRIKL